MDDPADASPPRHATVDDLDALFEQPESWASVDPEKLRHLLFYECLAYGLQPEGRRPRLSALHRVAVERLPPAVRRQVLVHVARAVERVHREHDVREGAGCTNAFLPFLLEDPDPTVVSSAAVEMALLLPLENADPLTGPRYVRSLLDEVTGEDRRAGIIAGVLQVGDERVAPLVSGAWRLLAHDGRETLALLIQAFRGVHRLVVDFLVSWLEDEAGRPESPTFGVVAATLARAGRYAGEHGVVEARRVFPVTAAPESQPFEALRELSLEELGPAFAQSLLRAAARERPPQLMPHVLSYWGLEDEAYRLAATGAALRAAATIDPATAACEPVALDLAPGWPEEPERETLLEWGVFNPLGPTINTLRLTPVASSRALVYTLYHPAGSSSRLLGLVPPEADAGAVVVLVRHVMSRNGRDGLWMLRSLPDYVHLPANSCLDLREVAGCLAAARARALAVGEEPTELAAHAERLGRLAADPWGVAQSEIEEARARQAAASLPPGDLKEDAAVPPLPSVGDYVGWLRVAAAPAHVAAVRPQLPIAWQRLEERE